MVSPFTGSIDKQPPTPSQKKEHTQRPFRQRMFISGGKHPETNGLENLWKQLYLSRISQIVSQLITRVRREPSTPSFKLAWRKRAGWCIGKKVDPLHCDVTGSLKILGKIFSSGL